MSLLTEVHEQNASTSEGNSRIYDFLKSHPVGVLSTVDPNGNPHATVIYYSVDDNFKVTFTTKRDTKKNDNITHNNHVMLIAFDTLTQTTAQITGLAVDISETAEAQRAFSTMLATAEATSKTKVPPISKLLAGPYVCYEIKPVQIRMAVFVRPNPGGFDIYETIDFKL